MRDPADCALPAWRAFVSVFGHETAVIPGQHPRFLLHDHAVTVHAAGARLRHMQPGPRRPRTGPYTQAARKPSPRLVLVRTRARHRSQSVVGTPVTDARRAAVLDGEWDTATVWLARAYQSVLDACAAASGIPS